MIHFPQWSTFQAHYRSFTIAITIHQYRKNGKDRGINRWNRGYVREFYVNHSANAETSRKGETVSRVLATRYNCT